MTTFTTEDRQDAEKEDLVKQLQERIEFLEAKNKWLISQVEQLEIQLWGSR
jgi:chaperonin cofactor prefoldin